MNDLLTPLDFSRRSFLRRSGAVALASAVAAGLPGLSFAAESGVMVKKDASGYLLPPLGYDFDALEPHIDAKTMEIHHDKHHAGYTSKLNAALEGKDDLKKLSITELLGSLDKVDESIRTAVRNNGGGYYNHSLFWDIMSPDGGKGPEGDLAKGIESAFGSFEDFRETFSQAAATRFGSGWAWLIVGRDGKLAVTSTPNQDSPLMTGVVETTGMPILGLDVWEHAYYLHYQNRRADYISSWFEIVNWSRVAELHKAAMA